MTEKQFLPIEEPYSQRELRSTDIPYNVIEIVQEILSSLDADELIEKTLLSLENYFKCQSITITMRDESGVFRIVGSRRFNDFNSSYIDDRVPSNSLTEALAFSDNPLARISEGAINPVDGFWFIMPIYWGVAIRDSEGFVIGTIVTGWEDAAVDEDEVFRAELFARAFAVAWQHVCDFEEAVNKGQMIEQFRIAQDLHDSVAQSLFAAELQLRIVLDDSEFSDNAKRQLLKIDDILKTQKMELRRIVNAARFSSNSNNLKNMTPQAMIEAEVRHHLGQGGVSVDFAVLVGDYDLLPDILNAAKLVVREGLSNIRKHAYASRAAISASVQSGFLLLAVSDDGRGPVDSEHQGLSANVEGFHFGLESLSQLIDRLGGTMVFGANENGKGSVLWVKCPARKRGGVE
ncbi:MAG: histidine kinase [Raoultibacter sp.]